MERFAKPFGDQPAVDGAHIDTVPESGQATLEEDPNQDRRKRQKTESPPPAPASVSVSETTANGSLDWYRQLELQAEQTVSPQTRSSAIDSKPDANFENIPGNEILEEGRPTTPANVTVATPSTSDPQSSVSTGTADKPMPKKKTIKIGKNGKLLSSPPKPPPEAAPSKKRQRRKPKLKPVPTVTVIKYGNDNISRRAIGEKIEAVMCGEKPTLRPATPKKIPIKPSGPPKPTHPFFLGKPAPRVDEPIGSKQTIESPPVASPRAQKRSAVTPGKLRAESKGFHSSVDVPTFGLKKSRNSKQDGLIEAPWPAKEIAHVRNLDDVLSKASISLGEPRLKTRKLKNIVPAVSQEEDLVEKLASQLQPAIQTRRDDSPIDFAPPEHVRLPTRLLTTGVSIQNEVRRQVASLETTSAHPAVLTLFADIEHAFTAFDLGKCEPLSWVQKYAPNQTSHVLQYGKEPAVLKDWLLNLTVLAVSGKHAGSKATEASDSKKHPKKKRKKAQDDFIVDSDEEEEEDMIELAQDEAGHYPGTFSTSSSLRRARWTRNKNVVLISGPHGSGKSAMVQAVAKDLDFEIFEINSGSRRSGKDIQDKVGDMTENHLVSHRRKEPIVNLEAEPVDDTENERHSDALQKDLDSGRQGTMMSFFNAQARTDEKPRPKPKASRPKKTSSLGQATLPIGQSQRKSQKQSLILFEEADILYDEDQGFWAQVTRLAAQSKRPIIITCTNEALIPIHELPLAAILRLSPPPVPLATDYLAVLAGREGHVLERDAVSSLYLSKNRDLRASITELQLWCQMSVGDRKGGLEWNYQRWPPGKDVDQNGRPFRVASKSTYLPGMGCMSHNLFESEDNVGYDRTEELLKESWQEWGISPSDWSGNRKTSYMSEASALDALKRLDMSADSISAADIYCCVDLPSYNNYSEQPMDPSLPQLSDKARLSYTLAAPVLQVDHATDFSHLDTDLLTQTHLLVQRAYGGRPHESDMYLPVPKTEEGFASAILIHKESQHRKTSLSWPDFSQAFDILAYPPDTLPALNTSYNLTASSFDRTFRIVVEDLAPYVRSIVANELVLENQRLRLGNLLSEGGSRSNKRQRTTRAARTALEGGSRDTKRREHWFDKSLNRALVMGTGGKNWAGLGIVHEEAETESRTESVTGTQESMEE